MLHIYLVYDFLQLKDPVWAPGPSLKCPSLIQKKKTENHSFAAV